MTLGARIRQARKAAGYSLRDLANRLEVSAMAISKYERDLMAPSSDVLISLAQALGVRVEYFFRPAHLEIELKKYRKHPALSVKEEHMLTARIQEWLERYLEAEALFPQSKHSLDFKAPVSTMEEVEAAAEKLRSKWDLGKAPIESLMALLEDRGVAVGPMTDFDKFDACTFQANGTHVIVVNQDVPGDRQRFNLAHELGHIVLEVTGDLNEEDAAYHFAGAFLVPAGIARQELGAKRSSINPYELYLLKHKYGLSMQAWIYRAKDLKIISQRTYRDLFDYFEEKKWRREEPGEPYHSEEPQKMQRLVMRALAEDMISRSRAEELLGMPLESLWASEVEETRHGAAIAHR